MSIKTKFTLTPIALVIAVSAPMATSSFAQDNSGSFELEEVIVTARKVEESLQDVPLSITAIDAKGLAQRSIEELDDLALYTPGLSFEDFSNGGFGTPVIRGATQFRLTALEQNVSTYLDGVFIPRGWAVDIGTTNLNRIEVVKGPQSALYGSNAFLGAINYVSTQPNLEEFEGGVTVTLGSDERRDVQVDFSVPIIQDKLAIRLGAGQTEFDGDWENFHPNANAGVSPGTDGNIGGWDNQSYRLAITAQPTDALKIELALNNYEVLTEARAQTRLTASGGDLNCSFDAIPQLANFFSPANRLFCGELPGTPVLQGGGATNTFVPTPLAIDPRTYGLDSETDILRFNVEAQLSESIGVSYQFSNTEGEVFSAGVSSRDQVNGEFFFIPPFINGVFQAFTNNPAGSIDYDTHELRFDYTGENGIVGLLGVYILDGEDVDGSGSFLTPDITGLTPQTADNFVPQFAQGPGLTKTESQAIFGRIEIPLAGDNLRLSAEARYIDEEISNENIATPYEDDYFTGRVSLDYELSDDSITYVSVAQGVKSGGQNANAQIEEQEEFGADENITYEVGYKGELLDGRMQLNAAAYLIDWSDLQIGTQVITPAGTAPDPFLTPVTENIGSAEIVGFEVEMVYVPVDPLTLNIGFSYNDATYDSGTISQRLVSTLAGVCFDGVCNADGDVGGNTLARAPDTQWNLGAQYDAALGGTGWDFFVRADVVGQTEQFLSEINAATIPSRTLVNLRAGVSSEHWSVDAWVKNAADREYVSNSFFIIGDFGTDYVPTFGDKRQFGVTLDYTF